MSPLARREVDRRDLGQEEAANGSCAVAGVPDLAIGAAACTPRQYLPALALDRALGDPGCPENLLSFHAAMTLDEAEQFPDAAISMLHGLGLARAYVPRALGGDLESGETFVALGRVLARRDMTVAVSYSTMLWSTLAWIGADPVQQRRVAGWVAESGWFPCLAYSEAGHGADLAANAFTAARMPDGSYRLNGEKWPINRGTRSDFLVLLARTDAAQSLRNHSLFVVDKSALPASGHYRLPKAKTHGLRGCDISGIGFRDCPLPGTARIGAEGSGLELALKGFQVTRTFCTALSLGVGDSVLRLTADFCAGRALYGTTVDRLPHARDVLSNAYLSQLMGECVSIVAARGLHLHPAQFSAWSSIAKVHVTQLVDEATRELAAVFGARHYLREGPAEGVFQKFMRDGAIVSVFDGSSIVCLDSLATLLPSLVRSRQAAHEVDAAALFDLTRPLPALAFDQLDLFGRGRDAVLESWPRLCAELHSLSDDGVCPPAVLTALCVEAARLDAALDALDVEVLATPTSPRQRNSAQRFRLAERYVELHGAAAMLGLWLHNRLHLDAFFGQGHWLLAALVRDGSARWRPGCLAPDLVDALQTQLDLQCREQRMFSLLNWPLAPRGSRQSCEPLFEATRP